MENIQKKSPLFFIYLAIFINIVGFGMIFPLLPIYAREFQASETVVGFMAACFAVGEFLFAPLWGRLSDRFGRKPIILLSLLGISIAFAAFAIANNLTWLFISRFLQGVFASGALTAASAYVADVTTKEERIKGMSRLGASLATGFIFGPAIGGFLSSISHQLPFFLASILTIINTILVALLLKESLKETEEKLVIKEGFINLKAMYQGLKGELGSLFILIFIWSYALSNNQVTIPLFGTEILGVSVALIGIIFSVQGIAAGTTQWFLLDKIAVKLGEFKTAFVGLSLMMLSLALLPFSSIFTIMALIMVIFSFGSAITRPTIQTLISKTTREGQGTTMGIASAFESSGRIIGPILGGWLFSRFGFHAPFTISALLIFFILFAVVRIKGLKA
ncbi:MFS transporter [Candidatus Daviesbacteria bacterium]|nr:MFS transporter [Candidatus Daviesbacteria bacterium]